MLWGGMGVDRLILTLGKASQSFTAASEWHVGIGYFRLAQFAQFGGVCTQSSSGQSGVCKHETKTEHCISGC